MNNYFCQTVRSALCIIRMCVAAGVGEKYYFHFSRKTTISLTYCNKLLYNSMRISIAGDILMSSYKSHHEIVFTNRDLFVKKMYTYVLTPQNRFTAAAAAAAAAVQSVDIYSDLALPYLPKQIIITYTKRYLNYGGDSSCSTCGGCSSCFNKHCKRINNYIAATYLQIAGKFKLPIHHCIAMFLDVYLWKQTAKAVAPLWCG